MPPAQPKAPTPSVPYTLYYLSTEETSRKSRLKRPFPEYMYLYSSCLGFSVSHWVDSPGRQVGGRAGPGYFLTIWMTSSCSMVWVRPTRCGLYLVLVPWGNRQRGDVSQS